MKTSMSIPHDGARKKTSFVAGLFNLFLLTNRSPLHEWNDGVCPELTSHAR